MDLDPGFVDEVKKFAHSDAVEDLLNGMARRYMREWRATSPNDIDQREHLWRMVHAVEALKGEIIAVASSEQIAQFNRRLRGKSNGDIF